MYDLLRPALDDAVRRDAGIGRRYRRQDEIGTPLCVTVDFQTVGEGGEPGDDAVTIRERDTQQQVRVPISNLVAALQERLPGC